MAELAWAGRQIRGTVEGRNHISGQLDIADGDSDQLAVTATTPARGQITVNSDDTFVYDPEDGFTGPDPFTVTVSDAGDAHVHGLFGFLRPRSGHASTEIVDVGVPAAGQPTFAGEPVKAKAAVTTGGITALTAAAVTVTDNVIVQAESMAISPLSAGKTYDDPAAAGGKAKLLSSNGSISTSLSVPAFSSLVIRAKGDQYRGAPTMTVSIDGVTVLTTSVSSTSWTDYTVAVAKPAGTYKVSIAFTNNSWGWRGNRNLRLDQVTVMASGSTVQPPPPTTTPPSSGTPSFFQQADWLWTKIPSNPVLATNSATWVSYLSAADANQGANLYEYGVTLIPASAITSGTPRYDVKFTKPWGSDPFGSYTVPIPLGTKLPAGTDSHLAVLDPISGKAFGLWQAKFDSATNTWSASWGGITELNGNGIDQKGTGSTATELARYAGVVTAAEFSAAIAANTGLNHALFFATDIAGPGYVYPAGNSDGQNWAGVAVPMPEGYRVQLDPSINVDAIPGITPGEKVIAKTLQTYGAYAGDIGGARMSFSFEAVPGATSSNPGSVWVNAGLTWDYYDMNHIPWSKLAVLKNWNGTA
ncbi:carbohydrate-binding domain-containing protein [Mycolicibacterium psychrotolerans]|uniref:Carbohydrate binding module xylan-binding domain-containing protein n=1 Tax=Mycolicibacterium psychrotolerans TaxID=216929 RepID=A0A7I7MG05_9MYCO|nr:carbohydrate-binding domain-containing protein [Mycolicibacterium psychrotolerans]BBX70986.1 hypothetical protein MPSYJ_44470 [Mycolicibacterium psychrotolerans]